jgi:hypothetical protein
MRTPPPLDEVVVKLLRTLAEQDLVLDRDIPEDNAVLAKSFGSTVEELAEAQQRLGNRGFASLVPETSKRVRTSITHAGREYLKSLDGGQATGPGVAGVSARVWWNPRTWF